MHAYKGLDRSRRNRNWWHDNDLHEWNKYTLERASSSLLPQFMSSQKHFGQSRKALRLLGDNFRGLATTGGMKPTKRRGLIRVLGRLTVG